MILFKDIINRIKPQQIMFCEYGYRFKDGVKTECTPYKTIRLAGHTGNYFFDIDGNICDEEDCALFIPSEEISNTVSLKDFNLNWLSKHKNNLFVESGEGRIFNLILKKSLDSKKKMLFCRKISP